MTEPWTAFSSVLWRLGRPRAALSITAQSAPLGSHMAVAGAAQTPSTLEDGGALWTAPTKVFCDYEATIGENSIASMLGLGAAATCELFKKLRLISDGRPRPRT